MERSRDDYRSGVIKVKFVVYWVGQGVMVTVDLIGRVRQWDLNEMCMVKEYGPEGEGEGEGEGVICSIVGTRDGEWFFVGDCGGRVRGYSVGGRCLGKDFGRIHRKAVKVVYATADSKMLISADLGGNINVFSIELGSLAKYFPRAHDSAITSIVATPKGDIYASGDIGGS